MKTLENQEEHEEWIDSFSGLNGRSEIGISKHICKLVRLSDFIEPPKHRLGVE